jgi:integrase
MRVREPARLIFFSTHWVSITLHSGYSASTKTMTKKTTITTSKTSSKTAISTAGAAKPSTSSEKPLKQRFGAFSSAADTLIAAATAKATKAAYASDMRHWLANGGTLPAVPAQIVEYLAQFAEKLSISTLERRLIAIHQAHKEISQPSPARDMAVRSTMQGIRRTHGKRKKQAQPLLKDDLLETLVLIDRQKPVKAARDRALLLVGFAGAFRRSELVAIRVEDIKHVDSGVEIFLPHSKTDQKREGDTKFIPCANGVRCPVAVLAEWLAVSNIETGYVFRAVDRHDNISDAALTAQSVRLVVKKSVERVGGDKNAVSAHSLRSGYITQAAIAGHQIWQIKLVSLHTSDTVVSGYIRPINKRKVPSLL